MQHYQHNHLGAGTPVDDDNMSENEYSSEATLDCSAPEKVQRSLNVRRSAYIILEPRSAMHGTSQGLHMSAEVNYARCACRRRLSPRSTYVCLFCTAVRPFLSAELSSELRCVLCSLSLRAAAQPLLHDADCPSTSHRLVC